MPFLRVTANLRRHVDCPDSPVQGSTAREALEDYFRQFPGVRGYVFDDQSLLRKHMAIFLDGRQIQDRETLSDALSEETIVDVVQSLSGG
jgi:sulfur-carrier protein